MTGVPILTLLLAVFLCFGRYLSTGALAAVAAPQLRGGYGLVEALAKVLHRECRISRPTIRGRTPMLQRRSL